MLNLSHSRLILKLLLGEALDPDLASNVLSTILDSQRLPKLEALDCTDSILVPDADL